MLKHLNTFCPTDVSFQDIDKDFVERFKENLGKDAMASEGKKTSQNSKYSYSGKFNAVLKQEVKDGIIRINPVNGVEYFKQGEPQREFFTLNELQLAVNTECELPLLTFNKCFYIFCAYQFKLVWY